MRYWKRFVKSLISSTNQDIIKKCQDNNLVQINHLVKYSSRIVFAINDSWVIKIALTETGIEQNKQEIFTYEAIEAYTPEHKKYFSKVLTELSDNEDFRFVIMQKLINSSNSRKGLKAFCKNEKFLESVKRVDTFMDLCNSKDIKFSNLGITKSGKIKLLDYGCSRYVVKAYRDAWLNGDNSKVKNKVL